MYPTLSGGSKLDLEKNVSSNKRIILNSEVNKTFYSNNILIFSAVALLPAFPYFRLVGMYVTRGSTQFPLLTTGLVTGGKQR